MPFKEKLIRAMEERGVSQTQLSGMTGIGKSSISQYINGKNVPSVQRRRQIEKALSLAEGHLDEKRPDRIERMTVQECARVMGLSREKLVRALEAGICAPWGIYIAPEKEGEKPVYWINRRLFYQVNMPWVKEM